MNISTTDTIHADSLSEADADAIIGRALAHIERTACSLTKCPSSTSPPTGYALAQKWIEDFVMKPHPDLGRDGPICPFVELSYRADSIYVASLEINDLDFDHLVRLVLRIPGVYKRIMNTNKLSSLLFSLIILLPNLERNKYFRYVDLTQTIAKPIFMNAGLMIGEFHPESRSPGVHSPLFHPMRSDIPAFVVRAIAPHDVLFIDRPGSPTAFRIHEIESFLAWSKMPAAKAEILRRRLDELKSASGCPS